MKSLEVSSRETTKHGYPRPQLMRADWICLNGEWQFAIDPDGLFSHPKDVDFAGRSIIVPFAPETTASGIGETSLYKGVWYRRTVDAQILEAGERLVLHFGAVDFHARVWINGQFAVEHEGGYTPFFVDITPYLIPDQPFEICLRAEDNPFDLEKNRGKQDWEEEPHGIWYQRTTGIWQTVWMEVLPPVAIDAIDWEPCIDNFTVHFVARLSGCLKPGMKLAVTLLSGKEVLADDTFAFTEGDIRCGEMKRTIQFVALSERNELPDGSSDRIRERYFWHPNHPNLLEAAVSVLSSNGAAIDSVASYTQLMKVEVCGRQIFVNNCPDHLRLVLDQGYWPESGMTPPDDEAIKRDIELIKAAGFNGVRKHNKLEDPRFLYWADKLGLFVWEELPSAYRFSNKSMARSLKTWTEAIERDRNHRCVIAWVPINESWGVLQLPQCPLQRDYQRSMYRLTKSLTRGGIVVGNDGWEMVESDIVAIHDYDGDVNRIGRRYTAENLERLFREEKPGGRTLLLDGMTYLDKPIMITEFGGIKLSRQPGSWGYSEATSPEDLAALYAKLMEAMHGLNILGGFCYTEFTDVYQEANGLFWMDRTPKFPIELMRKATQL